MHSPIKRGKDALAAAYWANIEEAATGLGPLNSHYTKLGKDAVARAVREKVDRLKQIHKSHTARGVIQRKRERARDVVAAVDRLLGRLEACPQVLQFLETEKAVEVVRQEFLRTEGGAHGSPPAKPVPPGWPRWAPPALREIRVAGKLFGDSSLTTKDQTKELCVQAACRLVCLCSRDKPTIDRLSAIAGPLYRAVMDLPAIKDGKAGLRRLCEKYLRYRKTALRA
jgi:hypothetical protein